MSKTFEASSVAALPAIAKQFLTEYSDRTIFAFYGEMGVGKTTFIKTLCEELGVEDNTSSPTFAIVNEYSDAHQESIYHFDCYRLEDEQEALDFGIEEYFYSGNRCFIEWPERIPNLLPDNYVRISISEEDGLRTIKCEPC